MDQVETEERVEEESSEEDYEDIPCKPVYKGRIRGLPTCSRLEEMSRPKRHYLLALYLKYGYLLPPEKFKKVKKLVEEAYAMSPEQTKAYFQQLQEQADKRKQQKQKQRKERLSYKLLKMDEIKAKVRWKVIWILRECLMKAYTSPMKILMSERLRLISNVCLCQLCGLLSRTVPDRDCKNKVSRLLISLSDWMAYWIETIVYDIEASKKESSSETDTTVKEINFVTSRTQTEPTK